MQLAPPEPQQRASARTRDIDRSIFFRHVPPLTPFLPRFRELLPPATHAAIETTGGILSADPLNAEAYFVRGMAELAAHDPIAAAESLRRALYIEPTFALAAFQLGRAHDRRGDARAAVRAYRQALRAIADGGERHHALLGQVSAEDVAAACRTRLREIA
ncbi:MAG TPA: hypothetical protein VN672_10835 [Solirubrobacteraceae bacterium]|nr:hypothetical protein [Solirubrobacteraceae bacterium]